VEVAEANRGRTQLDVDRYTPLARQAAITQQDLDNAIQNNLAARAQLRAVEAQVGTAKAQITAADGAVQSAKAAIATAQINLGFTRLASPIDGIPGIAELQVGALVSPASGAITTMSTLDPIKVYFTASEQNYLAFARRFPTATLRQADLVRCENSAEDGSPKNRRVDALEEACASGTSARSAGLRFLRLAPLEPGRPLGHASAMDPLPPPVVRQCPTT
jgi:multidrug efflux pump subunit AcrA (membrane-fusion protein)